MVESNPSRDSIRTPIAQVGSSRERSQANRPASDPKPSQPLRVVRRRLLLGAFACVRNHLIQLLLRSNAPRGRRVIERPRRVHNYVANACTAAD